MKQLSLIALLALFAQPVWASPETLADSDEDVEKCEPQKEASIYTTHIYNAVSLDQGQKLFDGDKAKIAQMASSAGVKLHNTGENLSLSLLDYSFSAPDSRGLINFSANLSYKVSPVDKSREYFRQLAAAGINNSYSYSMTNNCEAAGE